jgi:ArsR family transcriptional regulator
MTTEQGKKYAAVFKALGHPSRLRIIGALGKGERCVCELREAVGADMSTVSRHLAVLRNAGLIVGEKRGLWVWYTLCCPCVMDFLKCVESVCPAEGKKRRKKS